MSEIYLGVLEPKYVRDFGGEFLTRSATKADTMKMILCAQFVKQNLKIKSIFCLSIQHA